MELFSKTGETNYDKQVRREEVEKWLGPGIFEAYLGAFENLVASGLSHGPYTELDPVSMELKNLMKYASTICYHASATFLLSFYLEFCDPNDAKPEKLHDCYLIASIIELFQSTYNIIDDIADKSFIRGGVSCWHHTAGDTASQHAFFLEAFLFQFLKENFSSKPYYIPILHELIETNTLTQYGQFVDNYPVSKNHFRNLDFKWFKIRAEFTATHCVFTLPLKIAAILAQRQFSQAESSKLALILQDFGYLTRMLDDHHDVYNAGKADSGYGSTDIREGKTSWLYVYAITKAKRQMKEMLVENYGEPDPEKILFIRDAFSKLGVPEHYFKILKRKKTKILDGISKLNDTSPKKSLKFILDGLETFFKKS